MFESLDEQMQQDAAQAGGKVQRILCWTAGVLPAVLVRGGLYFGVKLLE
jgi:hypothetical protein